MPRLDGTGPQGEGPKTGRGLGNCRTINKNITDSNKVNDGNTVGRNKRGRRFYNKNR